MPIVRVGGEVLKFPDTMSQDEIKVVLDQRYGSQPGPEAPAAPVAPQPSGAPQSPVAPSYQREDDLIDRTLGAAQGGIQGATEALAGEGTPAFDTSQVRPDIQEAFGAPTPSALERTRGAVGSVMGGLGEAGGEIIEALIPEFIKEPAGEAFQAIMSTEPAQAAVKVATDWAKENPYEANAMGDVANIAALGAPGAKFTTRSSVGKKLSALNEPSLRKSRQKKVQDMLEPEHSKGPGELTLDPKGKKKYVPTQWETDVIEEVAKVKGLNPSKSATDAQWKIRAAASDLRKRMEKKIDRAGNPQIDKQKLIDDMDAMVDNIPNMPEGFVLSGDSQRKAKDLMQKARQLIHDSDGSAKSVLQARRDFDKWVRAQTPNRVYDPDTQSAIAFSNKLIRNAMNDKVDDALKGKRVNLRGELDRQHKLLSAADVMLDKAYKERSSRLGRVVQKFEDITGVHMPTTPVAMAAIPAAGAGFVGGMPAMAATFALGLTGIAGVKGAGWLASAPGRAQIARLITALERDPLGSKFKADRAALLDMINGPTEEEETED